MHSLFLVSLDVIDRDRLVVPLDHLQFHLSQFHRLIERDDWSIFTETKVLHPTLHALGCDGGALDRDCLLTSGNYHEGVTRNEDNIRITTEVLHRRGPEDS